MFKQEILLLTYNKDVVCVVDEGQFPVCKQIASAGRRNTIKSQAPSHDPYIPRQHALLYNCTSVTCEPIKLQSLTQITNPNLNLQSCYLSFPDKFECQPIRFSHFKPIDKLSFLRSNIQNKTFYIADCLIYPDAGRVCHRKSETESHVNLVDVGALVRPKEQNILSQEEFLCEETDTKHVNCDLDPYVPYADGLKLKPSVEVNGEILLKTGSYAVLLSRNCIDSWCGFSGSASPPSRRTWFERYEPPGGGKVYRCYSAKHQQICKLLWDKERHVYNEREYVGT